MDEGTSSSGPSAKILQAPTAWALLLPVRAVLRLAHNGAKRRTEKPSPESCASLQVASLGHLEGCHLHLKPQSHPQMALPSLPVFSPESM